MGAPTITRSRQAGRVSPWLAAWALFALSLGTWLWPKGNPATPVNLVPGGTLLVGDIPTSTVTLHWRQGGIVRTLRGLSPDRAYRFVICFYASNTAHDCATPSGTIYTAEAEAQTITRREVRIGDWTNWALSRYAPTYDYDFDVSLSTAALDVLLEWTVGACSEAANTSCTFAEPKTLALTARDIAIQRIDDQIVSPNIRFNVVVRNDGRTSGESYRLDSTVWEVLILPNSGAVLADINHNDVMPDDLALNDLGEEHPVSDCRSGRRDSGEVRAIHRPGQVRVSFSRVVADVPQPKAAGEPLLAGACGGTPEPCNFYTDAQAPCASTPCVIVAPRPAAGYAFFASVNSGGVPWDFDTVDNTSFRIKYVP